MDTKNIPQLVDELISRTGLPQEKLAARIKISLPTINRWKSGRHAPDQLGIAALEKYVRKLGAEHADLLEKYFGKKRKSRKADAETPATAFDTKDMETMLWKAACSIRGEKDAPKFKDYILPLIFVKRLSDVFEDELARLAETYGDRDTALSVVEADPALVRFYIPAEAAWPVVSGRQSFDWPAGKKPKTLGEQLTTTIRAIAKANPMLQGVIDIVDYNETRNGEREISDDALHRLIETLSIPRYRLGLADVEPDFLGRAYEYLLRKFAEGQGQSAGEFFTPKEVGWLIAYMLQPQQGEEVYDPCGGSGGLLIKCQLALGEREKKIARPLKLYGQELTGSSFAIARMNMIVHDMEGQYVRGNSMTNPKYLDGAKLKQFDLVVANPMWNQDNFDPAYYETDPFERFAARGGFAPEKFADWAWLQHIHSSLKEHGRAAVVIDTGAVSRGSGGKGENRERSIRKWFVDNDIIDAVILLPDNLFYNTTAAGVIIVMANDKPKARKGKVVLINAAAEFEKGRPKNFLTDTAVRKIADAYHAGREMKHFAAVVANGDIAEKHDYNLSPSRYVEAVVTTEYRDIQTILNELSELDRQAVAGDRELKKIFAGLGYDWK